MRPRRTRRPLPPLAAALVPLVLAAAAVAAPATGSDPGAVAVAGVARAEAVEPPAADPGATPARPAPAGVAPAGTIRGTATINVRPPRRTARRYPGGGAAPAKRLQELPAVVYVKGSVGVTVEPTGPAMAQRDTAFHPGILVVPPGTEVSFPNGDDFFHNVFSYSDTERFDLGRYPKGEAKTVLFDEVGVVRVYCEVHDHMRAVVLVTESGLYAVVGEDGGFSIPGVPAGRHTVVLWHADLGETEAEVEVPEGGVVEVDLEVG